ncbi:SspB-related isopeptide-forming adhesin [Streptococcus sp. AM43-2AT]|uniref:SspB-related isopeptide-forming adhesin n=1 Tax=Streptococcus sp. AM43-2AT TaxID=2293247 RepID=UPI000EDC7CB7|nr:SspB-related isopeptide-forming adhesin [Streptococcus sp. AM43-2AT]RJU24279.1 YSIRK-type signal peptide-containing protein [Streptococcus sp. AM43-2AT]
MKEMFNRRQRFSLRKYSVGVCSVLLGTALFAVGAPTVAADDASAPTDTSKETASVQPESSQEAQDNATVAPGKTYGEGASALKVDLSNSALAAEAKAATETPAAPEAKPAVEATPKAEETAKPATAEAGISLEEHAKLLETENAATAKPTATDAKPATDESNKPRVRSRRAATDHNSAPVSVETYLRDGETATPDMTNPNGATVSSQTVPSGYAAKEGDWYTYAVWDLTEFNNRYGTKYYARAYKRFDESTDTTVELIDKTTGNVVETRTITSSSGVQKFTTTTAASNSQLTFQVDYKAGTAADKGKVAQPFIQNGYEVGSSITNLVAPGHKLTPEEQALYTAVYNARTTTDILNVVEPAYNGRTITDSNAKIPEAINKTTYYKVVDKNNPTFNANKTDKTVQDYKENGNEVDLARYTTKAMEGQSFTASGERQFDGYKLYQTADANDKSGYVSRPYTVGTKFMDADRYGIKRIKEVVGEDGSVVIRVYLLDPKQQSKRSDGTLETDGYMLLAETKPIKPGDWNSQELVVKKSPLNTIPHTVTDPKTGAKTNYPNGKELEFDFYKGSDMPPYHAVFVPFLGDNIGYKIDNAQLERGIYGSGIKVDLANSLTPYKQPVYYYVKQEPVEVTPEVEKQLEGRVLTDGEFTFKLTEDSSSSDKHEETVTNKDGKATFSKLTFTKTGTYKYKITEQKGSDTNVDYDAMTVTMTVTVTENNKGDLEAAVKYSAEGGFKTSDDDKVFNNYVVAPVKTKFDFTKKLAGRELKDGEFKFVLKDANGQEVETVTNKADGTVTFTELSFDNSKVGSHTYTVEEVIPAAKEAGMVYDTMKATITVEVAKNGHTLTTVTNVSSTGGVDANGNATDGTADKEFNNKITPPETPEFQPEKFVLNKEKFDLTGTKLMDDDDELQDEYTETNANPYADQVKNNEAENINTKTVERGDKLVYQVWLDTKNFTDKNNIQSVGISDTYDADKLTVNSADIKAYDSETGVDVTSKFDITVANGVITATSKASMNKSLGDADNTQVIDTTKFAFGRYYKFDIPATVKDSVAGGVDIENKANQIVHVYNPVSKSVETPEKPTQKRVNSVPITAEFNFTKRLEGRELKAGEFTFELKDSDNVVIATATNDADGKIKFSPVEYTNKAGEKVTALKYKKGQEGTYTYSVTEVKGTDTTVTYDTMKAEVTVTVSHDGTAKALVANVTEPADKEFNNTVTPPTEPKFQPEKYVLNTAKYSITDNKLLDDDAELTDKYGETNTDPYVDKTNNNEAENINTKTVNRGDKLYYQVWLDTTKFSANNKENVQSVGITDDFDETKVDVDSTKIKAYDSVSGNDVTNKFDIKVENGVMTATLKAGFTKSLGDTENTQIIDTTKFEFGRYYKFDIPAVVKADVAGGVDIENTAAQVVNYYNSVSKTVEKPNKPTEKRVNSVPVSVEFNFTKRLEGRELKANEFSFVLKDSTGKEVETVKNDADGKVKFSAIEFKKEQAGVHNYTVEEVKGTDTTVTYDTMKANVTVTVSHDGTAKVLVATVGDIADKEFNNRVTPPTEPKFQPEKYVLNTEKYSITDNKLLDDDAELADKYADTNANPYADDASNNEAQNLNTKTVERGSKLVYQVWLDTTKFDANNKDNIQSVGISDDYDEAKLDLDSTKIKAYDSVTGAEVTDKFDIAVNNGVITATLKAGFTKSLGDAENTQIIDTTKFAFGRYYKFDIPTTVKADVAAGADIENTAAQVVNYYNPTTKKVETPNKPTEKRVNNVPVPLDLKFTKSLEGRQLQDQEFTFVLKKDGNVVETVKNDESGKINFKTLKFGRDDLGKTYNYTVEEVRGTDSTVSYDPMVATVKVVVSHDGTAKAIVANVTDAADKEFNNTVTPPTEPKFQPEKYVLNTEKYSITDNKLLDDDAELTDKYGETNTDPYVDKINNNEAENINTKTVKRGDKLVYQVWLDTTKFDAANKDNIQSVGISDNYDETKLDLDSTKIKAYDSVTGAEVTDKFDIAVDNGVITATLKAGFTKSLGDAENTQIIDTTKFEFGRYYKFDIPTTVKADVPGGVDIENTAAQVVNYYNPTTKKVEKPSKPTEKRVNNVPVEVEFNFTKRLEGRELKANEFSFVLKDSTGKVVETVSNDAAGNVKFSAIEFKKEQAGVHNYTVEEVAGTDATVTYDTMKANVTVTVSHDGTAKVLVATVGEIADKEFNNRVTPPEEPKFQPEKYVVSEEKFDITGDKLVDDDKELADKYADTNANPYADDASNNEKQNLNTKTVKRGDKLVYQVWLDTTKFSETNKENIQSVGISDDYDETKLDLDSTKIKAYDSVTGDDVTDKFDIAVDNGVITATLKAGFTKSLGDAENTQIIDTTKFAFGRYYKFDIPTTVKADVAAGVDIENTAAQVVNYYNPTTKKVEKPSKPTEKRVNNVPVSIEFNFTKKLEGRELQANEFSFVLKDSTGKTLETVSNDAAGNVKFSALEFKKGQEGVHNYTVEEVKGSDATVTYDTMKANVTVTVSHDGTAKVLVATVGEIADKEFNNRVTPPETPEFNPEKYVLNEKEFDLTGTSLLDDDKELADKVADTNANPYADDASNNEAANINTKTVKPKDKLVYQVWLDTTKFDAANKNNIQSVGITDDYDETKVDVEATTIKAYDGKTGADVTDKFDIVVNNGVITATLKAGFTKSLGDADNTQIIDTTKFEFGRYYKFEIPATVKADVAGGVDIENTAAQVVNYYNPTTKKVEKPSKPTEKRVNSVPVQVEFNFTKRLEGRELKANEFSFVLKDSTGKVVETVSNDKDGNVKFSKLEFKKEQAGVHNFTVEEVKGTDGTVTYDAMKANVTVTVKHDGTAKVLVATVGDIADKEFNNKVTPPETPEFNPEKYILNESKFDITGDKLVDDDKELADKVADTNKDPYADKVDNNEAQNINTKTLKKGDKVYYQVWLDTTKLTEAHNIQSVGVTDKYDSENLDVNVADIKAYDSVTGEDVTAKFDIKVENGVITATSKTDLTKSLGDAENTPVIDTAKLAFGRYYKFEIPATIKATAKDGVDIENTASQTVHQYDPTKKSVEKPEKPTEKRVVNIPTKVEFNFTKKLEGRELKEGEFSFVLKDKDGKVIETVKNDASGNIKFSALEFKRGDEETKTYTYTVEEVKGTEAGVEYDKMVATVTVTVTKEGKVLTATSQLPKDTEFNNKVIPPKPPVTPPTPPVTPPTPPVTPPTPPVTPPTPPVTPPAPELPSTGEEQSASAALLGAALGLVGLAGLARRKKNED